MNPPPLLPTPKYRVRKPVVMGGIALAAVVLLALVAQVGWHEMRREDSPENYARLCELLLEPLPRETGETPIQTTKAEDVVWQQKLREELTELSQRCRRLAPVAENMARELAMFEQLSKDQPSLASLILSGAEAAIGFRVKSDEMLEAGSKGVLRELKGYGQIWDAITGARERIEVARVQLANLAPAFSGPVATNSLIEFGFTETAPSLLDRVLGDSRPLDSVQTMRIRNRSGRTLSQCVVTVRLVRPSGESFLHIYRVGSWGDGEWRRIRYSPGHLFAGTHADVNRVQVGLAAREASSPEVTLSRSGEQWPFTK